MSNKEYSDEFVYVRLLLCNQLLANLCRCEIT